MENRSNSNRGGKTIDAIGQIVHWLKNDEPAHYIAAGQLTKEQMAYLSKIAQERFHVAGLVFDPAPGVDNLYTVSLAK